MQNVPIRRKSRKRKAIRNSFRLEWILFQQIRRHSGINKVVNNKKNKDIPSKPSVKFRFKVGNQKILWTNWKELVDFWKKLHKSNEPLNDKQEHFRATVFNNFFLLKGIKNKRTIPKSGSSKIISNKFLINIIRFL